jgi:chromosome partitioning related protein ParA
MTHTTAAISTKGGVGKTTTFANLGGLLADIGFRTLLLDADVQPSLSKYYPLEWEAPGGLVEVIKQGQVTPDCISRTTIPNLDLIKSNDGGGELQFWLHGQPDERTRLASALASPFIRDNYDYILIDTQGAIGPLQTAAAFAADTLLCPLPPDTPSLREFKDGMLGVLRRLEHAENAPTRALAPIQVVLCRFDYSRDAKGLVREFSAMFDADDRVSILEPVIPQAVAYREAFTLRLPVHRHNQVGGVRTLSGFEVMHRLLWALHPDLYGVFAGGLRANPDEVFGGNPAAQEDPSQERGAA